MFHIGQRVVCVNTENLVFADMKQLHKGGIYTIRGFLDGTAFDPGLGIYLEEIIHPLINFEDPYGWLEPSYWAWRFRPVIDKKTSIEIFQKLLIPEKENA